MVVVQYVNAGVLRGGRNQGVCKGNAVPSWSI
jgi:hypothetical protein